MTLRLNGSNSGFTEVKAPATAGSNTLILPTSNGSANQFLQNGSTAGLLEFAALVSSDMPTGSILQVKQATDNTTHTITGGYAANIVTQAITPTSSSSKFLLIGATNVGQTLGSPNVRTYFVRDSTDLGTFTDGNRLGGIAGSESEADSEDMKNIAYFWLDSPSTTSQITYKLGVGTQDGNIIVNRVGSTTDATWATRTYTTLTVLEVAG